MADVTEKHLEMARLYLYGPPEVRGNWRAAGQRAGFERVPGRGTKTLALAIEQIQAEHALAQGAIVVDPGEPEPEDPEVPEDDEDMLALAELLANQSAPDWSHMMPLAKRLLAKIAAGQVRASAAQIAALREILKQHASTPEEDPDKRFGPVKVVILPAFVTEDGLVYVEAAEA